MNINKAISKTTRYLKRSSPEILSGIAVVGVIATAVLAVKATPKARQLLYEEKVTTDNKLETIRVAWKPYIPAIATGTATIACIVGANVLNRRQQAALTSAYIFLEQSYKEYRNKVKALYGDEGDKQVRSEVVKEKLDKDGHIPVFDGEKCTFYEENYGKFFERSMLEVREAEYQLNRKFMKEGGACLNDFFDFLGLPNVKHGDILGWSQEDSFDFYNYTWIEFEHELLKTGDEMECYEIKFGIKPTVGYDIPWKADLD